MSLFGERRTKTVTLARGYVDPDGNAHREVTLRVPMIEDEIRRDAAIADMRRSSSGLDRAVAESETLQGMALIKEVIVSWDGIADVQLMHLRSLSRADAARLHGAMLALEAEDATEAKRLAEGGPEGNEEAE